MGCALCSGAGARWRPDPGDIKAFCSGCGAECGRTKGGGGAAGHIPRHWLPTRTRGHQPENDKRLLRDSLPGGKALGQAASLQAGIAGVASQDGTTSLGTDLPWGQTLFLTLEL